MKKLINSRLYKVESREKKDFIPGKESERSPFYGINSFYPYPSTLYSVSSKLTLLKFGFVILLSTFLTLPASAQWEQYHFQRSLSKTTEQWHSIELPNELFQHLQTDYDDLRIMGITASGDTIEAPYLVEVPQARAQVQKQAFKLLNQSRRGGRFYLSLENSDRPTINRIELDLSNKDFDWRVQLEGSNDQRKWFTLLADYRILSLNNQLSDYRFTTLHFPNAQYQYYRIAIPENKKVTINGVSSFQYTESATAYRSYTIGEQSIKENKKAQRTEIEVGLPYSVPVSYLSLEVKDELDYYRPITVEVLSDSVKTENGWTYRYRTIARGVLSSLEEKVFTFSPTRTRKLRIAIENYDNTPLQIGSLQVQGEVPVLKARFTQEADYVLLYGQENARAPRYDIVQFKDKVPDNMTSLSLGEEVRLIEEADSKGPLFANKAWLWGIMIVVIGLLGWSSIRMLKNG